MYRVSGLDMEHLRKCRECGLEAHATDELKLFKNQPNAQYEKDNLCKKCASKKSISPERNKYTRNRARLNKVEAIKYKGGKCVSCGLEHNGKNAVVFDFHHTNSKEKEYSPASLMKYKWESIIKELDKCILLCSNCHKLEHQKEEY